MQIRKRVGKRGVILVMTLFFMVLFAFLSIAFYQLSPSEIRRTSRERTMTEAHYACTAGIRMVRTWISAATAPSAADNKTIEFLADDWGDGGGKVSAGTTNYDRVNNDPFSVPPSDKNYKQTTVADLKCPHGKLTGTDVDFLGLQSGVNLSDADYKAMKADKGNWVALASTAPLKMGDYEVYTYVVPSSNTMEMMRGNIANGLRAYLITTVTYKYGEPLLRARCLLKEQSAADYAYRNNQGATDAYGNPITFRVSSASDQLFDGPVHTNNVPYFTVNEDYWDAPLVKTAEYPDGVKAISGTLTFAGTDAKLTPSFDGVGWEGGNYNGTNDGPRPHDAGGSPIASSAGGKVVNRYDRFIQGGRSSIRKTAQVALPSSLTVLKTGAFGSDTLTGLDSSKNQVGQSQVNGALQTPAVARPGWMRNNGSVVNPTTLKNSSDNGIFINTVKGTSVAAGGVVIKGDTRAVILEVTTDKLPDGTTDPTGYRIVGSDAAEIPKLEDGTAIGNPTIRVQTTTVSYDENLTSKVQNYKQDGFENYDEWVSYSPKQYKPDKQVTAHNIPGCPSPVKTSGSGAGAGQATYSCPHKKWVKGDEILKKVTKQRPKYVKDGTVDVPREYRAQDWVVEVKNTNLTIPNPKDLTGDQWVLGGTAWKNSVGGNMNASGMDDWEAKRAPQLNINKVFLHDGNSENGVEITAAETITPAEGKIVLFKQSRSDSQRLDVFIVDKPSDKNYSLNGAVYSTGDISGLRGVNMDRRTIGTDYGDPTKPNEGKGIAISDSVWQYGTQRGLKPDDAFNGLGLVASKMNVQTDDRVFGPTNPLRVYATIVAGKSGGTQGMDVSRLDRDTGADWGRQAWSTADYYSNSNPLLQIVGGLTEQQAKARLSGNKGFSQNMLFDRNLALNPPPFFPATNLLQPVSYSQERLIK